MEPGPQEAQHQGLEQADYQQNELMQEHVRHHRLNNAGVVTLLRDIS